MIESHEKMHPHRTIFIGGLPGTTDEMTLKEHFSSFGEIEKIELKTDRRSNLSKGYSLITFKAPEAYESAIRVPDHFLFARTISCQPFLKGEDLNKYLEDLNSRRLFVKYIPKNFNNKEFEDLFQHFGEVDFGYVVKDPKSGRSRGFGYITFKHQKDAQKIQKVRCLKLEGNKKLKIFPYKRRNIVTEEPSNNDINGDYNKEQFERRPFAKIEVRNVNLNSSESLNYGHFKKSKKFEFFTQNNLNYYYNDEKENFDPKINEIKLEDFEKGKECNKATFKNFSSNLEILKEDHLNLTKRYYNRKIWKEFSKEKSENEYPDFLKLPFILPVLEKNGDNFN